MSTSFYGLVKPNGPWNLTPRDRKRLREEPALDVGGGVPAGGTLHAGHANWLVAVAYPNLSAPVSNHNIDFTSYPSVLSTPRDVKSTAGYLGYRGRAKQYYKGLVPGQAAPPGQRVSVQPPAGAGGPGAPPPTQPGMMQPMPQRQPETREQAFPVVTSTPGIMPPITSGPTGAAPSTDVPEVEMQDVSTAHKDTSKLFQPGPRPVNDGVIQTRIRVDQSGTGTDGAGRPPIEMDEDVVYAGTHIKDIKEERKVEKGTLTFVKTEDKPTILQSRKIRKGSLPALNTQDLEPYVFDTDIMTAPVGGKMGARQTKRRVGREEYQVGMDLIGMVAEARKRKESMTMPGGFPTQSAVSKSTASTSAAGPVSTSTTASQPAAATGPTSTGPSLGPTQGAKPGKKKKGKAKGLSNEQLGALETSVGTVTRKDIEQTNKKDEAAVKKEETTVSSSATGVMADQQANAQVNALENVDIQGDTAMGGAAVPMDTGLPLLSPTLLYEQKGTTADMPFTAARQKKKEKKRQEQLKIETGAVTRKTGEYGVKKQKVLGKVKTPSPQKTPSPKKSSSPTAEPVTPVSATSPTGIERQVTVPGRPDLGRFKVGSKKYKRLVNNGTIKPYAPKTSPKTTRSGARRGSQ